jgi:hypothetical protein
MRFITDALEQEPGFGILGDSKWAFDMRGATPLSRLFLRTRERGRG